MLKIFLSFFQYYAKLIEKYNLFHRACTITSSAWSWRTLGCWVCVQVLTGCASLTCWMSVCYTDRTIRSCATSLSCPLPSTTYMPRSLSHASVIHTVTTRWENAIDRETTCCLSALILNTLMSCRSLSTFHQMKALCPSYTLDIKPQNTALMCLHCLHLFSVWTKWVLYSAWIHSNWWNVTVKTYAYELLYLKS